jgi:hypothetical protein
MSEGAVTRGVPPVYGAADLSVTVHRTRSLTPSFHDRWADLFRRSLEDNPFLAPGFILPALEHLPGEDDRDPLAVAVESPDGALLGLGFFEPTRGSKLLPLPHLTSWRSMHSFNDGMLLDRDQAAPVADTFFQWLTSPKTRWHGVAFHDRSRDSDLARVLEAAARKHGGLWREDWWGHQAWASLDQIPNDPWEALRPSKKRKEVRRRRRILEGFGVLNYRVVGPHDSVDEALETFFRLETMGWKGRAGSALAANLPEERFARAMVANFSREESVIFPLLEIDETPVAAGLMLMAGSTLFAFKSGYHTEYSRGSPGVQMKLFLLESVRRIHGVTAVDSCAAHGSWLEPLWPGRKRVTRGVFATTPVGRLASAGTLTLKKALRRLRSRRVRIPRRPVPASG